MKTQNNFETSDIIESVHFSARLFKVHPNLVFRMPQHWYCECSNVSYTLSRSWNVRVFLVLCPYLQRIFVSNCEIQSENDIFQTRNWYWLPFISWYFGLFVFFRILWSFWHHQHSRSWNTYRHSQPVKAANFNRTDMNVSFVCNRNYVFVPHIYGVFQFKCLAKICQCRSQRSTSIQNQKKKNQYTCCGIFVVWINYCATEWVHKTLATHSTEKEKAIDENR